MKKNLICFLKNQGLFILGLVAFGFLCSGSLFSQNRKSTEEVKSKQEETDKISSNKKAGSKKPGKKPGKKIDEKAIVEASLKKLVSPRRLIRYGASSYLLKYYKGGSDELIINFLRDRIWSRDDHAACYNLIRLLGKIKASSKDAIQMLINIVGQVTLNPEMRISAIESLGKTGDKNLVKVLEKYILIGRRFQNPDVYFTLVHVSGKLRGKPYTEMEIEKLKENYKKEWYNKNKRYE